MTKTELMETYTAEQLADMVAKLESELNITRKLENEVLFEERIAKNIRSVTGMNIDDVRKTMQDTKKYMNDKYAKELQSEVEKYRKAFEDAKKERDCQIAEYQKKIEELKVENAELHCEMQAMKVFPDEIPTEPIKVAEMLITEKGECEPLRIGNDVFKDTYRIFNVPDLRQIAEHLIIYCNHNGEAEE